MRRATPGFSLLDSKGLVDTCWGVAAIDVGGSSYVFAANAIGDRIDILAHGGDGLLAPRGAIGDTSQVALDGVRGLAGITPGNAPYLLAAGFDEDGLTSFRVGGNGALLFRATLRDDAERALDGINGDIETVQLGRRSYALMASQNDSGVQVVQVQGNGKLTARDALLDAEDLTYNLAGARDLDIAEVGGRHFVYVAANVDNAVGVLELIGNGRLQFVGSEPDTPGLALSRLNAVEVGEIGNRSYLFAAGEENTISAFKIGSDGSLSNVHLRPIVATTQIGSISALEFATIGRKCYLFAADVNGDAINVLEIARNGLMSEAAVLTTSPEAPLGAIRAFTLTELADGSTELIATGTDGPVSTFRLTPADFEII